MMQATLSAFWLTTVLSLHWAEPAPQELKYTGTLSPAGRQADKEPVKRFVIQALLAPNENGTRSLFVTTEEEGGGQWPWAHRYGLWQFDSQWKATRTAPLRLLQEHDALPSPITLQSPIQPFPEVGREGLQWVSGKEQAEIIGSQKMADRDCWQVAVTTNFGRKRTLWVDKTQPILVGMDERLFLGQGDEFALKIRLDSIKELPAEKLLRAQAVVTQLTKLQTDLNRPEQEFRPELSAEQVKLVEAALPALQQSARDTSYQALVAAITRDVRAQQQQSVDVSSLAKRFVGMKAPDFTLTGLDRKPIGSETLKDKIVVLHFWDYHGEPLLEPYGQVAYLDFLHGKRRKLGVQIIGVAVDPRLKDPEGSGSVLRAINRFKEFMRLEYPIAIDDGSLLTKFGDPRRVGAKLPLWVVITPDGIIRHYQTGYYVVKPDEGLRELDDLLVKLIKDQRETAPKK